MCRLRTCEWMIPQEFYILLTFSHITFDVHDVLKWFLHTTPSQMGVVVAFECSWAKISIDICMMVMCRFSSFTFTSHLWLKRKCILYASLELFCELCHLPKTNRNLLLLLHWLKFSVLFENLCVEIRIWIRQEFFFSTFSYLSFVVRMEVILVKTLFLLNCFQDFHFNIYTNELKFNFFSLPFFSHPFC